MTERYLGSENGTAESVFVRNGKSGKRVFEMRHGRVPNLQQS